MTNHIADRYARIEAEFKAIKKLYEATKVEALDACLAAAGEDLKAFVAGDEFALDFSLTATRTFSLEKAKALGFITEEQIEQCKTEGTRQNLKPVLLAKTVVYK